MFFAGTAQHFLICIVALSFVHIQTVVFGDRTITMHYAALPEYLNERRTTNPDTAMWIVVGVVVLMVVTAVILLAAYERQNARYSALVLQAEKHRAMLVDTAREAHERTIAYACHQLRYGRAPYLEWMGL